MFSSEPVIKLSTAVTRLPSRKNRSQRWEPRKPAPPVTTICFRPRALVIFSNTNRQFFAGPLPNQPEVSTLSRDGLGSHRRKFARDRRAGAGHARVLAVNRSF